MRNVVKEFLLEQCQIDKPLLVGLSGGPDSLLLLHLLVDLREELSLELGVAHVDHGWRPSSGAEAAHLQAIVLQMNIPFHLKRLETVQPSGRDLENRCRRERHDFFRQLCCDFQYQAVLLGHHGDDHVETVLKRLFEASTFSQLGGIQPVVVIDSLKILRPLLRFSKRQIVDQCARNGLAPIDDVTNRDSRFMRARLRQEIIPYLSNTFGKQIAPSLHRLAQEAHELNRYLDERIVDYLFKISCGPFGFLLDLSEFQPLPPVELNHLLRHFFSRAKLSVPWKAIVDISAALNSRLANRQLQLGVAQFIVDRGRLFICEQPECQLGAPVSLLPGCQYVGEWQITAIEKGEKEVAPTSWYDAWHGSLAVTLPAGEYRLVKGETSLPYPGSSAIRHWWNEQKVPAFMRTLFPLVVDGHGAVVHEFLSGRCRPVTSEKHGKSLYVELSLTIRS
jgi:tRNA(Ile)-lysidine synthase